MHPRLTALYFITDALREAGEFDIRFRAGGYEPLIWEQVVEFANLHLLSPALWTRLRERGTAQHLPADLQGYLSELHRLSALRNEALRDQTLQALGLLQEAGIDAVLMKGAAYLFTDEFPDPASRIMTDIDMLVPATQSSRALEILKAAGYEPAPEPGTDYGAHRHLAPLVRAGDYAAIELHSGLFPAHLAALLPDQAVWDHLEELPGRQPRVRVLSPSARLLVNFAHAQLIDRGHGKGLFPLRSLFETSRILHGQRSDIEWDWLYERIGAGGKEREFDAYLHLVNRLFGEVPEAHRPTWRARLHAMRCLAQWRWPTVGRCGESVHRYYGRESLRKRGLPVDSAVNIWLSRLRNTPRFLRGIFDPARERPVDVTESME